MYKNKKVYLLAIFFASTIWQGCDQVSSLKDYFSPPKKQTVSAKADNATHFTKTATAPAPAPEKILAKVGTWTITIDEFKKRLEALQEVYPDYHPGDKEQDRLILEELIRQQLLVQEAERTGLGKDQDIAMAVDEFRKSLLVQDLARQKTENIAVTDEEVKAFYEQNKQEFVSPTQWHVREIVVETEDEAKAILIDLYKGDVTFEAMAKERSQGATADDGGDMGYVETVDFPKMESVVSSLDVGGMSSVFQGPEGYYIIKLEEKKEGEPQPFDLIKEDIKTGLILIKQQQAMFDLIENLRQKTKIETNESLL